LVGGVCLRHQPPWEPGKAASVDADDGEAEVGGYLLVGDRTEEEKLPYEAECRNPRLDCGSLWPIADHEEDHVIAL